MEIVMMYFSNTDETEYLDMKYCHLPTYGSEIFSGFTNKRIF